MGVTIKSIYNRFRLFEFTYWAMMLSILGMYSMYIVEQGFSKKEISITVTVFTFSALLGQNVLGYMADRFKSIKGVLLISLFIAVLSTSILFFTDQTWCMIAMIAIWGFFMYGTVPLSDAWFIGTLKENGRQNDFGKIRGLGSIGYAISGVFLGLLLEKLGWRIYYWYILISVCFTLVTILLLQESKGKSLYKVGGSAKGENGGNTFRMSLKQIITIKPLRFMILIVFVYNFIVKGIYNYLGVLVSDFGGGPLKLGFAYFFDAAPEVITFFLTTKLLRKYRSKSLIFMAFALQIIRLCLILAFNSSLAIILLGSLSGFAYGLLATSYKTYIYELAPDDCKISCLSLGESIIGLSTVLSAPVFGFFITQFGGYTSIIIGLVIDILAAGFLAFDMFKKTSHAAS